MFVDKLGENFDSKVMEWKSHLVERTVDSSHVQVRLLLRCVPQFYYLSSPQSLYSVDVSLQTDLISHSFDRDMDVSNFQEFDSCHSDDNPLTSTLIKMSAQEKNSLQCISHLFHPLSYLPMSLPFQLLSVRMILHDIMM